MNKKKKGEEKELKQFKIKKPDHEIYIEIDENDEGINEVKSNRSSKTDNSDDPHYYDLYLKLNKPKKEQYSSKANTEIHY